MRLAADQDTRKTGLTQLSKVSRQRERVLRASQTNDATESPLNRTTVEPLQRHDIATCLPKSPGAADPPVRPRSWLGPSLFTLRKTSFDDRCKQFALLLVSPLSRGFQNPSSKKGNHSNGKVVKKQLQRWNVPGEWTASRSGLGEDARDVKVGCAAQEQSTPLRDVGQQTA